MNQGNTQNVLIVFGSLTGIAFVLVGATIALVYADGASTSIVLPILLAQIGPLIILIMNMAKAIENGTKADTVSTQVSQVASMMQTNTPSPVVPPPVVVNVPTPEKHAEGHSGPA